MDGARRAWGQIMEGEDIGDLAVMETEVMSSPPLEYSSLLEMPFLCEEVA